MIEEVKVLIADLTRDKYMLEEALEENGGELTEEMLAQYDRVEEMKTLLAGERVDELGRWLKSIQDEIATRKAEADAATRKVKNLKRYEDYAKFVIGTAMDALGEEKTKGAFYGFTRTTSTTNKVDQDALEEKYLKTAEQAIRHALIPEYVHIELKATTTELKEAGATEFVVETNTPSLRFTKPRANQKKEGE